MRPPSGSTRMGRRNSKTEGGIATRGDFQAAWFRDPDGNILCIHSETR